MAKVKLCLLLGFVFAHFFFPDTLMARQSGAVALLGRLDKKHGQGTLAGLVAGYSSCWGYTASNGKEYALIGVFEGTAIIDLTDPSNLIEVAFVRGPNSIYREMKTYLHYAYIVSEGGSGVQIVDLSPLPDSVRFVKAWTYGSFTRAHTISQSGPYLYLNGGNAAANGGVAFISLSDPINPAKVGEWSMHYVHDCYVRNDTIYAAGLRVGFSIIDARDKLNARRIKQIQYPFSITHNVWTSEDGKYVFTTDETSPPNATLKIWDIRNLEQISMMAEYAANPYAIIHNVYVRGNYAHIAYYSEGYVVVDISDPARPVKVGSYDTYFGADGVFAGAWNVYPYFPSGKIILSDIQTGLYVFSFASPVTRIDNFSAKIPEAFYLGLNYPNPFNPSTTIRFGLPRPSHVTLNVFNALGQEVAELVNEQKSAGNHAVSWDATANPSGVYFYRLRAEEFVATKKLLLLK